MNFKNILLSCVLIFGGLSLSGCYTQLSMFHPDPEIEEEFHSYSVARVRPNLTLYANDGAGQSLGMAYQMMYSRFHRYYGNQYSYWNPYYYGGIYNDYVTYDVIGGTYTVWIPGIKEKKQRIWTRDGKSSTTNLNTTRTRSSNTSQSSNSGYSNSSNVSSTRSSSGSSSSSSSNSSSSGGTRVTKRN